MQSKKKEIKYPENLYLRLEVFKDKRTHQEIATAIEISRKVLSDTINGKYKGTNIVPKLLAELATPTTEPKSSN
ncbi:MAG TPA: hypothetical protein VK541_11260 [Pedobacter sp.]|uniref:hypothetical protein n=1 Tax=Pedobacter sp. TaxID=1411316 RepID=UPI002CCE45F7|nr:hypothetical protein [Pedobacter sp.]HMI03053.1 hypothetical protein [Pedobacter sp.]